MPAPYPANNPVYTGSLFPNAVDEVNGEKEMADAIMATQQSLIGGGAAGTGLNNIYAGTVYSSGLVQVGAGSALGFISGASIYSGSGAPAAGKGANGDYYFRTDTPGTANQRIYVKSAGAWVGIV